MNAQHITPERLAELREFLQHWEKSGPDVIWNNLDFEDFNVILGDLWGAIHHIEYLENKIEAQGEA